MPVKAAPPTSFMITFNNEEAGSTKPKPLLTLQDAARQAPTGRRLFNRNPETNHRKSDSSESSSVNSGRDATNNDPKRYLFKKMIQGYNSKGPSFDHQSGASDDDYHESDLVSEAGTYVIGTNLIYAIFWS
jgi:hypothetical protein